MKPITFGFEEVPAIVAQQLIPRLATHTIFTFKGPLGAGKTTMIKSFLAQAGITDIITSPTFTYVKRYQAPDGTVFYHFDLYRLNTLESFIELGFDEYLQQEGAVCVIEWPGVIGKLLHQEPLLSKTCAVELDYIEGELEKRSMGCSFHKKADF